MRGRNNKIPFFKIVDGDASRDKVDDREKITAFNKESASDFRQAQEDKSSHSAFRFDRMTTN